MGRSVGHFEIIPRGRRAKPHLAAIRRSSECFKQSLAAGDAAGMQQASVRAWDALAATFEILRGEQDDGYLADAYMQISTGFLIEGVSAAEQTAMIVARKIDRSDSRCGQLTLREALNKIAHYRSADATFRVDRRGAHYLVLGGNRNGRHWIAAPILRSTWALQRSYLSMLDPKPIKNGWPGLQSRPPAPSIRSVG